MVDRTKRDIVEAFNQLIATERFDQITAQRIAAKAGVSRATFYRYFKDKYDVMNYNYKAILDTNALASGCASYLDLFRNLLVAGERHLRPIRGAFKSTGVNSLESYVFTYSREFAVLVTKQNRGGAGLTQVEELQLDVFCYGVSYMYKKFVMGAYDVSIDEAAAELYEMMPASLRGYWLL